MSSILDNLTAIVVGAVLVGALLAVQMRQQEQAIATTVQNRVSFHADEFLLVVSRDAENIRTRRQTEHALGDYRFEINRATGTDGETYTSRISFPTLADPQAGDASPVGIVSYAMEPTGQTVRVGQSQRPTYRITRSLYTRAGGTVTTGGAESVLDFDVFLVDTDGSGPCRPAGPAALAREHPGRAGAGSPGRDDGRAGPVAPHERPGRGDDAERDTAHRLRPRHQRDGDGRAAAGRVRCAGHPRAALRPAADPASAATAAADAAADHRNRVGRAVGRQRVGHGPDADPAAGGAGAAEAAEAAEDAHDADSDAAAAPAAARPAAAAARPRHLIRPTAPLPQTPHG